MASAPTVRRFLTASEANSLSTPPLTHLVGAMRRITQPPTALYGSGGGRPPGIYPKTMQPQFVSADSLVTGPAGDSGTPALKRAGHRARGQDDNRAAGDHQPRKDPPR